MVPWDPACRFILSPNQAGVLSERQQQQQQQQQQPQSAVNLAVPQGACPGFTPGVRVVTTHRNLVFGSPAPAQQPGGGSSASAGGGAGGAVAQQQVRGGLRFGGVNAARWLCRLCGSGGGERSGGAWYFECDDARGNMQTCQYYPHVWLLGLLACPRRLTRETGTGPRHHRPA